MRIDTSLCSRPACVVAVAFFTAATLACHAQTNKSSTVLYLPNPTPRPPDLEQRYGLAPVGKAVPPAPVELLNAKRQALIAEASRQLAALAGTLQNALTVHKPGASFQAEAQVAAVIVLLADDVRTAENPGSLAHTPRSGKTARLDSKGDRDRQCMLVSDTDKLVALTQDLKEEVGKTDKNMLSIAVSAKSAEIEQAARSLEDRLRKTPGA